MSCAHRAWLKGCQGCRQRQKLIRVKRQRAIRAGTWRPPVPVADVVPHIDYLRRSGWTLTEIANAALVPIGTVQNMIYGRSRRVSGQTADRLLSLRADRRPPGRLVDATGTRRRLQALVRIGYTLHQLSQRLGHSGCDVWVIAAGRRARVTRSTADAIAALYRELWLVPGPSALARRRAERFGWASPMDWDDIDDPDARPGVDDDQVDELVDEPDHAKVARALAGDLAFRDLSPAEKQAAVAELARHHPDEMIAARLRSTRYAITKFRERHGIPPFQPCGRATATHPPLEVA